MTLDERNELLRDTRPGHRVQTWYCSDCDCEHTASVIGGVVVPPLESPPLQSLKEVESTREEREDYEHD